MNQEKFDRQQLKATLNFQHIPYEGRDGGNLIVPVGNGKALAFCFDEEDRLERILSSEWVQETK